MPTKAVALRDLLGGKRQRRPRRHIDVIGLDRRRRRVVRLRKRPLREIGLVPLATRIWHHNLEMARPVWEALAIVRERMYPAPWVCPPHRWIVNERGRWCCAECSDQVHDPGWDFMRLIGLALCLAVVALAAVSVGQVR